MEDCGCAGYKDFIGEQARSDPLARLMLCGQPGSANKLRARSKFSTIQISDRWRFKEKPCEDKSYTYVYM